MNIFDKRPLFLIITIFTCGFVIFTFSDSLMRGVFLALAILLLGLSLFLYFYKNLDVLLLMISSIAILISMLASFLYFDVYFRAYEKYDDTVEIEGTVISVEEYDTMSSYTIKTKTINGKWAPYKIRAYTTRYTFYNASPGTQIRFNADLCKFENFSDFNAESYNFAKGISAEASNIQNVYVLERGLPPLEAIFANMRAKITAEAIFLSDYDSATFLVALLLGERDLLSNQLALDFKRLGITHILALSGQHLTILSLAIQKLLSIFKVNKKPRLVITSVFIVLYVALTGFSVSVVRAGIMVLIYSALFLLQQTSDSLTSLAISLMAILVATPYAVYDVALWLSVLATFGIVATAEVIEKKRDLNAIKRLLYYIGASIFVTFVSTSGTLAITAYVFGATSILAAPATLIFSVICELIIYVGSFMLIFGRLLPIGKLLKPLCDLICYLAGIMAEPDIVYVQIDYTLIKILILLYTIAFAVFLSIKLKRKKQALGLLASMFAAIMITATVANLISSNEDILLYSNYNKNDMIVIRDNTEAMFISCGTYSNSKAYDDVELLEEYRIQSIDSYYVTHYSKSLPDNIIKLTSLIKVDKVYIPTPKTDEEIYIADTIRHFLKRSRTDVIFYNINNAVQSERYSFTLLHTTNMGESSDHKCALKVESGDNKILYLSSGMLHPDTKLMALKQMSDSSTIIFGCHGKKYSDSTYITAYYPNIKEIIISSLNLDFDVNQLERYLKNGTKIHYEDTLVIGD